MTDFLLPTYTNLLTGLSAWLTKAGEHHADPGALMSARLAPDMFPLSTQIRFACVQAYEGVARLSGEAFPPIWLELLEEGRNGAAAPGTLADAQARIRDTLSHLASLPSGALDSKGSLAIAHDLPNGMVFDMTGAEFARDWSLPQFYFHVMTAYAILRHEGVPLGKADYVQHAFGYLRPGRMPGAQA
jgi:uncharacterized protein